MLFRNDPYNYIRQRIPFNPLNPHKCSVFSLDQKLCCRRSSELPASIYIQDISRLCLFNSVLLLLLLLQLILLIGWFAKFLFFFPLRLFPMQSTSGWSKLASQSSKLFETEAPKRHTWIDSNSSSWIDQSDLNCVRPLLLFAERHWVAWFLSP